MSKNCWNYVLHQCFRIITFLYPTDPLRRKEIVRAGGMVGCGEEKKKDKRKSLTNELELDRVSRN
jgi:hypothetical protein